MAYAKKCIYCHVVTLEGYNEIERKYYEQGTKQLHTRERCVEAKNRSGVGSTPTPQRNGNTTLTQQRTDDIKAAQKERKRQHDELIKNMQWLTKAIAHLTMAQGGPSADSLLNEIGFEEYREEQRDFVDDML